MDLSGARAYPRVVHAYFSASPRFGVFVPWWIAIFLWFAWFAAFVIYWTLYCALALIWLAVQGAADFALTVARKYGSGGA